MRWFAWLLAPDKTWLKQSLDYHERSNRHKNSLDPNYWQVVDRSFAGNLQEHSVPKLSIQERRYANQIRFTGRLHSSVMEHACASGLFEGTEGTRRQTSKT